jgi:hypothetical protein
VLHCWPFTAAPLEGTRYMCSVLCLCYTEWQPLHRATAGCCNPQHMLDAALARAVWQRA